MTTAATLFGADSPFDPYHKLVTSPFFSPTLLACFRALVALYTTATLVFILAYDGTVTKDVQTDFSYLTDLTFIGICSYYWASLVQTVWYIRRGFEGYPLQNWGKTLQVLHLMLQNTVLNLPIIVTIGFWSLIATPSSVDTPVKLLFTNNPPPQWIFLPFMILILGLYTALAYVSHATQGFYSYEFLDPEKQHSLVAAYVLGIVIGEILIFAVVWGIMNLRGKVFPASVRKTGSDLETKGRDDYTYDSLVTNVN
ncbi:hypothetical protein E1B28_011809 [Marasmius oreades]|uniref:Uncharacterized protein n=1 Tax=Marasmius oreades TaxID=181124 RepID=A0A9P7RUV5_9AGAR|nr:uncharacterized protein E1B28_011809 [Marasmius oreades]KAG7090206.1 hypothetical protein E1B28_011809 [Marasmius oreades]